MVHHSDLPCSPMALRRSSCAQRRRLNTDEGADVAQHSVKTKEARLRSAEYGESSPVLYIRLLFDVAGIFLTLIAS